MSTFKLNPASGIYTCVFQLRPEIMPVMLAFKDEQPHLLEEGKIETDYLDGSAYDSDGCEKELVIRLDYSSGKIYVETLPSDQSFWVGTENGQRIGMLGYYAGLLEDDFFNPPPREDYVLEYDISPLGESEFDEAFLWARKFVESNQDYSQLLSAIPSPPVPSQSLGL